MKKQILSIILALLLLCSIFPMSALADDPIGGTEGSFTWSLDSDGVLTVNGTGEMYWLNSPPWDNYKYLITSAVIGEGIEKIGFNSFYDCKNMVSVTFPESLTEIGLQSFRDCTSLTSISIPSGVKSIAGTAFYGCTSLTSVVIPEGVETIGDSAFSHCDGLESLSLPASLKSVGGGSFISCEKLKKVYYAGDLKSWMEIEFHDNPLREEGLRIGADLYINGELVTEIEIPEGITNIGNKVFLRLWIP